MCISEGANWCRLLARVAGHGNASAMDQLDVSLTRGSGGGHWVAARLRVNGRDLTKIVAGFERQHGWKPAGGYDWLSVDGLSPARDRLLGRANDWPGDGLTLLLVCGDCHEEGCWPLAARIVVEGDQVHWRDLRQTGQPDRAYTALQFTFDRAAYEAEIERAFESGA